MIDVRKIDALETFAVRHPVLRPGKPITSCHFDGDDLESTQHFGLFENNILVGVISLFEVANPAFRAPMQTQIRGIAVLENHRKKGFGETLIKHVEEYLRQNKTLFVWFNAREGAFGFYKKLGYSIFGNSFDIADVGIHYVMYKNLQSVTVKINTNAT